MTTGCSEGLHESVIFFFKLEKKRVQKKKCLIFIQVRVHLFTLTFPLFNTINSTVVCKNSAPPLLLLLLLI